ncbi:MAG: aminotransferase class III-fold pyridoxal phosphate-dependent enzyme, partial [Planctomycetota bacterium]
INVCTPEFLQGLRKLCDDNGMMLIFDEVQTGMGRLGEWFACNLYDITPDILTVAKSLGGGVAIGAMVARDGVAEKLVPGTHASTFGGNPLAAAAACAVFEAIEQGNLLEHARTMGTYLKQKLDALAEKHAGLVKEVRGVCLMMGMDLTVPGAPIVARAMEKGLLVNCTHDTVLRVMPGLTTCEDEVDRAIEIIDSCIEEVSK